MQSSSAQQLQRKNNLSQEPKASQYTKEEQKIVKTPMFGIFRYATKVDVAMMIVGSIAALLMGAAMPVFALLWGSITDTFIQGGDAMVNAARQVFYQFLYIGAAVFVAGVLMFSCWMISGQRQAIKCRKEYLKSLLRQEMGWFDMINQTELSTTFASDCFAFQGAIGQKVSTLVMCFGSLAAGFIIAFVKGWLMAFVVSTSLPAIGLGGFFYMSVISEQDKVNQASYSEAGGRAEQAISAIKTVKMLNGEQFQQQNYKASLEKSAGSAWKFSAMLGLGIGSLFFAMLSSYALGFWYGSILVQRSEPNSVSPSGIYTAGDVIVIFFSIVIAGFNSSQLSPALKAIAKGRLAATRIFTIIDRQPLIKNPVQPKIPHQFKGQIKFQNVTFAYPKQKRRNILNNLTIQFSVNNTALVGQSGCGKSTVLQLIMRFYDPDQGRITFDGVDLREIDLSWLRNVIGYVGQEPVLFATSLRENLLFGNDKATDQEINEALKKAQALQFVQNLEQKLNTYVGYGGGQLSGGQKQRIAIARALLKKPKVLLLDQATSALDRRNQKLIQTTLDSISQNLTAITVAHRVNTIKGADIIYVIDKGQIKERGKFLDLQRYKNHIDQEQKQQVNVVQNDDMPLLRQRTTSKSKVGSNKFIGGRLEMIYQKPEKKQETIEPEEQLTKQQKMKREQKEIVDKYDKQIFSRILAYGSDRKLFFALALIASVGNGVIFPLFSIYLANMITLLLNFQTNPAQARADANYNALVFFILGIGMWLGVTIQNTLFGVIGESITRRIRNQTYAKVLRMPINWFDLPRNNSGALSARLASDAQSVNTLTTTYIGLSAQNISTLVAGVVIGFVFEWRVALIALGLIPVMILAGVVQMSFTMGFSDKTDEAYKDSSNLITEAMVNIRTVTSFGYDTFVMEQYSKKLQAPYRLAVKRGFLSGILFGVSQFVLFLIFGLLFFLGAVIVRDNYDNSDPQSLLKGILNMFTAIYAIIFSAMTAGNNAHFMPDIAAAKSSAANLFLIQDSQDEDQIQLREESKMLTNGINGDIECQKISFKYQSRNQNVFTRLSVKIKNGFKVGFVGASGCGKSTIMQLLLRFYEPTEGKILINGIDIKDYNIHYLRNSFGVVSQEPVLFNDSFANNIRYNMTQITQADIHQAARKANALSFIVGNQSLGGNKTGDATMMDSKDSQSGFNRNVGIKGSHISGGQKQRVAIARAILRKPNILLLDQATSALDSANEKKVQDCLDILMQNKTTISIAHRLETIRNSDTIYVFQKGEIVESGNYTQLYDKKGYFYNLARGTQFV